MIRNIMRRLTRVVCVTPGNPGYEPVIGRLRRNRRLMARMWRDAESRLDEQPGKLWWVAVPRWGPRIAMAWCAAVLEDDPTGAGVVWRCCNSYDRPPWRWLRLYPTVYRARHGEVADLPAYTFVYVQPLPLHLADGWRIVGEGDSNEPDAPPHHWFKLRREPGRQPGRQPGRGPGPSPAAAVDRIPA